MSLSRAFTVRRHGPQGANTSRHVTIERLVDFGEDECSARMRALAEDMHNDKYEELDKAVFSRRNGDEVLNMERPLNQILREWPREILFYFKRKGSDAYRYKSDEEDWKTRKSRSVPG